MANSLCGSARGCDCPRHPLVRSEERTAQRNTTIQLFLGCPARRGHRCRDPAAVLVWTARVDEDRLPPRRGRRFVPDRGELATAGFRLLPLPYFPSPAGCCRV